MPTHIAKNRAKLKEKEKKEDALSSDRVEEKNEGKIEGKIEVVSHEQARAGDNGSKADSPVVNKEVVRKGPTGKGKGKQTVVGGTVPADTGENRADSKRRVKQKEKGKEKIVLLNEWANNILACLDPEARQNFKIAAFDAKVNDIGVYILGILNRMHKMADYFEPDIEMDWEDGIIGYDQDLYCQYCNKEIENPTNLHQMFCNNKCARNYKLQNTTGVLYPKTVQETSVDPEEKAWEREQKRMGANV